MTLRIEFPLATFFIPADYGLSITCDYMGRLEPCVNIKGKNINVDIYLDIKPIDDYEAHSKEYKEKLAIVKNVISEAVLLMLNSSEDGKIEIPNTLTADDFEGVKFLWKYFDV